MENLEQAEGAIRACHRTEFDGRLISVEKARLRKSKKRLLFIHPKIHLNKKKILNLFQKKENKDSNQINNTIVIHFYIISSTHHHQHLCGFWFIISLIDSLKKKIDLRYFRCERE